MHELIKGRSPYSKRVFKKKKKKSVVFVNEPIAPSPGPDYQSGPKRFHTQLFYGQVIYTTWTQRSLKCHFCAGSHLAKFKLHESESMAQPSQLKT